MALGFLKFIPCTLQFDASRSCAEESRRIPKHVINEIVLFDKDEIFILSRAWGQEKNVPRPR